MAMPIIVNQCEHVREGIVGTITPSSPVYDKYLQDLQDVEQEQFAKWTRVGVKTG